MIMFLIVQSGFLFLEPMSVQLNVDGVNDDCSQGKDINFIFKGFIVSGQVVILLVVIADSI